MDYEEMCEDVVVACLTVTSVQCKKGKGKGAPLYRH